MSKQGKLVQDQKFFFDCLNNNKAFSLFVVFNEIDLNVEDICIAPITEDMVLKTPVSENLVTETPEPIIFFPALNSEFEKFKDKHLKGLNLNTMPYKSFFRFDLKDTSSLPNHSLYTPEIYVQNLLIPILYNKITYNKTFREEYALRALKEVTKLQSEVESFTENMHDFSVAMIERYENIPHITEKQISNFLFQNLSTPKLFTEKIAELEALSKTQYYKINDVCSEIDFADDRKILPIDILIALTKGKQDKAVLLHHLYLLQNGKIKFESVPDQQFMYKQIQTILDVYRTKHPLYVEMSEDIMFEIDNISVSGDVSHEYKIMIDLLKDYKSLCICNRKEEIVGQKEKVRDIIFANIMLKHMKLFERVERVTNSWQQRFANFSEFWWEINPSLHLNFGAMTLKYEEIENKFFPEKEKIYCDIKFETKDDFYPLLQTHLSNILLDKSQIFMLNDEDFDVCDAHSLWKHFEEMSQCNSNDLLIFHTRFITNTDLVSIDTNILRKFIEEYIDCLGAINAFFVAIVEEKGQQTEVNIFLQNNETGKLEVYQPTMQIMAKSTFQDCAWTFRLPFYPLEKNTIEQNLRNYLADKSNKQGQSNRQSHKI